MMRTAEVIDLLTDTIEHLQAVPAELQAGLEAETRLAKRRRLELIVLDNKRSKK
jgi:hypothetical protein